LNERNVIKKSVNLISANGGKSMKEQIMLPDEVIISKIYLIRGTKVILDRDLAELYKVDTKQLKRAVRRNIDRFPDDFMFELSKDELANWRYQFGTSKSEKMGLRFAPFAFTEYGLLMLASILSKLEQLEKKDIELDDKVTLIFDYLKQLEQSKQEETDFKNRKRIGFKTKED
jgi:hypothetical protein